MSPLEKLGELAHIALHTALGFLAMIAATRILGKKQMAQLTYFEYVTGITIGALAGAVALDTEIDFTNALAALAVWTFLMVISNWASLKSLRIRRFLDGEPVLVISQGHILENNMRKQHYSMDDLLVQLRARDIFSVKDVEYAVLEPSGSLSVLKKTEAKQKSGGHAPATTLPRPLVMDGQIVQENLKDLHLTEDWLRAKLKRRHADLADVVYAELGPEGVLYVDRRKDPEPERV